MGIIHLAKINQLIFNEKKVLFMKERKKTVCSGITDALIRKQTEIL